MPTRDQIENRLKVSPFIREALVIGDRRKFVTALIGIEPDTVADWAGRRQLSFTTYRDLASKPEVVELIKEAVDAVNAELAQVEEVKAFIRAIAEGKPSPVPGENGLILNAIFDAIYKSSETGNEEKVDVSF